ncbi:hypothetical protein [Alkalihalobacterium bogoriense]|uniref:hypothetical protein n=1 Tax=Alkalihalobacterium bogoriense TaxID=246272 RepID=UPI00047984FF|nr:hypothetical protein [Alkalihalobacterium bogoriense]
MPSEIDAEIYHLFNKVYKEQVLRPAEIQTLYSNTIVEAKVYLIVMVCYVYRYIFTNKGKKVLW